MTEKLETPLWDVALEALACEHYETQGDSLSMNDFKGLAKTHSIRLDDIMETLFSLVIHGKWQYQDDKTEINENTLDELYVNQRLKEEDLDKFGGAWLPVS